MMLKFIISQWLTLLIFMLFTTVYSASHCDPHDIESVYGAESYNWEITSYLYAID